MSSFADAYLDARSREGRLLSRDDVRRDPTAPPTATSHERRLRESSYALVRRRIESATSHLTRARVLDLGCGMGWAAHRLSRHPRLAVVGCDLVLDELVRAMDGRSGQTSASFVAANGESLPFRAGSFDVVVASAVAQYFESLPRLIRSCLHLCRRGGEVLLADTMLYSEHELVRARARTRQYYRSLGCQDMIPRYHHHSLLTLRSFTPTFIYQPQRLHNRVLRRLGIPRPPFPLISFTADESPDSSSEGSDPRSA